MYIYVILAFAVVAVALVGLHVRHQRLLSTKAYLMREAIRNRDFTFRLPTGWLFSGERDMQILLNDMGREIQQLVDRNEVESWQKLTRVLTHEIMNDVTPIASISQSLLKRQDLQGTMVGEGVKAIYNTSEHLVRFVDSYRKFAHLQKPQREVFCPMNVICEMTGNYPGVVFETDVPPDVVMNADKNLMRHVIVNIVKNAVEAGASKVGIVCRRNGDTCVMTISNNGRPIDRVTAAEVFTPFFTTKTTGSGIGLSLSRQIVVMQGGSLTLLANSLPRYGVTFEIRIKD